MANCQQDLFPISFSIELISRRFAKAERRERGADVEQNLEIGSARPDDFPAIRTLCNGFLDWCRTRYGENAWFVDHYYTAEKWAALLDSLPSIHAPPDGEILVARLDGMVVGCAMLQRIDEHTCEMKRLFINADGRGLGLGRRLAETILRVASERGYTTMRLDTGRNHDEALRLYRSLGFQEIPPYYEAPPELRNHLIFMGVALTG
jgi:ribosomal protein S18 acetylase RimI-like enzyme